MILICYFFNISHKFVVVVRFIGLNKTIPIIRNIQICFFLAKWRSQNFSIRALKKKNTFHEHVILTVPFERP